MTVGASGFRVTGGSWYALGFSRTQLPIYLRVNKCFDHNTGSIIGAVG